MRTNRLIPVLPIAAAALCVVMPGCGSSPAEAPGTGGSQPPPTPAASGQESAPTADPEQTAGGGGSQGAPTGDDEDGGNGGSADGGGGGTDPSTGPVAAACTLPDLDVGVEPAEGGGAAGSRYVTIQFTNTGDAGCTMEGFAGVSFVGDSDGTQLGAAADRVRADEAAPVILDAGGTVGELVQVTSADSYGPACDPTPADGFRIYPPGEQGGAFVGYEVDACQHADGSQLSVAPVGVEG